jgi:hypothetical protein
MAFLEGCSCRVWALDGWVNDTLSNAVNNEIADVGNALLLNGFVGSHDAKAQQFKQCRISPQVAIPCVIYGEFEYPGDVTPTHMWLEYGAWIYDTIPGAPLRRKVATPASRIHPPSAYQYHPNQVGSASWYLSASHLAVLERAVWVNNEFMP